MRSLIILLIVIAIFILMSFLQQIHIRQNLVSGEEYQLDYVLPYIAPDCQYTSRYFYIMLPDCDQYSETPALIVTGSISGVADDGLFQYKRLMISGISLYPSNINSLNDWRVLLLSLAFRLRNWLYQLVLDSTRPVQAGFAIGLLFGTTDWLNTTLEPNFKTTGTLHILAASGSHVALIVSVLASVARSASFKLKGAIVLSGVLFYQLLLGAAPSITRATAMAVIVLFSKYFLFRKTSVTSSLVVASGLLLIWRPEWLFAIGFQLSVVATLGILVVYPAITRLLTSKNIESSASGSYFSQENFTTIRSYILDQLLIGASAELTILPLLLFHFGSTPLLGFVATTAVAWFVPFLMNSLLLGVLLSSALRLLHSSTQVIEIASLITTWLPVEFFLQLMRVLSWFNWVEWGISR